MNKLANITWSYTGKPDLLVGTQATNIEKLIAFIAGFIGVIILLFYYWKNNFDWTIWQYIIAAIIIYDVLGGVVANSLNSCKRFYHSSFQTFEPSYVKLAMRNMVKKRGTSLKHFFLTTAGLLGFLVLISYLTR